MKKLTSPLKNTSLFALAAVFYGSMALPASAQFIVDFTAAEGYSSGPLGSNADWTVFDGSGSDPNTFTVDASGSGTLTIDPSQPQFQSASYVGSGSTFTGNNYFGQSALSLDYANGTTSILSGAMQIPTFTFNNASTPSENMSFILRQIAPSGGDPNNGNRFNLAVGSNISGSNVTDFSSTFSGTDIGLAIDGSGNWTDGQSDSLRIDFEAEYLGSDQWEQTITLFNIDTAMEVETISHIVTDNDGSFETNDHIFRVFPLNMDDLQAAVNIDNIGVAVVPEPTTSSMMALGIAALMFRMKRKKN